MESRSVVEIEIPVGDAISRVRFAPSSNNLLISSWDSVLRLYDVDRSMLRFDALSDGALLDCCFEDESAAFSVSSDGCVRRYNFFSGTEAVVGKHDDIAICIEYSKETGQVITAGLDSKLMFWDIRKKDGNVGYTKTIDIEVGPISLCGRHLLAASGVMVNMYDLRYLKGAAQSSKSPMGYQIGSLCSFSNFQGYIAASVDGCVALEYFDPSKASGAGFVFRCHPKSRVRSHLVAVNDIAFHPQYDTFVTGDNDGYVIIWDIQNRKRIVELQRFPNSVASLSHNHDGQLLAIASSLTYQESNEKDEAPRIFIHQMDSGFARPCSS